MIKRDFNTLYIGVTLYNIYVLYNTIYIGVRFHIIAAFLIDQ